MSVKVPFPDSTLDNDGRCQNLIGRILGPRGISVRQLEMLYGCKILIRGKGSIKVRFLSDSVRFLTPRKSSGLRQGEASSWQARGSSSGGATARPDRSARLDTGTLHPEADEREALHREVDGSSRGKLPGVNIFMVNIEHFQFDEYKRQQLIQLAIINGELASKT